MRSKKKSEVEKYWRNVVEGWRVSGLSIKKFAEERNLAYKQLCFWRQRLDDGKTLKEKSKPHLETVANFAPVCIVDNNQDEPAVPANTLSMLEIVLLCGRTLRFNSRCQPEYLSSVVAKLEVC
jgi:transposase